MSFPLSALSSWKELRMCICKRHPSWLAGWRSISRGHMEPTSILGHVIKERFTEQLSVRILVSSDNSVVPPPSPEDTLCSPNGGDKKTKQPAGSQCGPPASLMVCSAGSLRRPPRPPPVPETGCICTRKAHTSRAALERALEVKVAHDPLFYASLTFGQQPDISLSQ